MILIIPVEIILFTAGHRPNVQTSARLPPATSLFPTSEKQQDRSCVSVSEELGKTYFPYNLSGTS